jgi:hypothetical protein
MKIIKLGLSVNYPSLLSTFDLKLSMSTAAGLEESSVLLRKHPRYNKKNAWKLECRPLHFVLEYC